MQSLLSVVTAAASPMMLTTLARIKSELDIADSTNNDLLSKKIAEASSDIEVAIGYRLPSETVTETYWHSGGALSSGRYSWHPDQDALFLRRTPVSAVSSVMLDDDIIDASEYSLDGELGLLYRKDALGFPCVWRFCKSVIVAYTGGYALPGTIGGVPLPPSIESAVVDLVTSFWLSRGRDPTVKSETVPGVMQREYWVGAVGDPGMLPPSVLTKITPFRRPRAAVA